MAVLTNGIPKSRKRKTENGDRTESVSKRRAAASCTHPKAKSRVEILEEEISESNENLNNVAILLSMINLDDSGSSQNVSIALSLCRIFSRLLAAGHFSKQIAKSGSLSEINAWLLKQYEMYHKSLLKLMQHGDKLVQITILRISLRMLKEEAQHSGDNMWLSDQFKSLFCTLVELEDGDETRDNFATGYMKEYHDCCYYTLDLIASLAADSPKVSALVHLLTFLSSLGDPPTSEDFPKLYSSIPKQTKKTLITPKRLKKRAESAWLSLLRSPSLTEPLRKTLLRQCTNIVMPWLLRPELLFDFLTDSYNLGGSTSLLALSGLFYLVNTKNLDYPSFYPKLYSLLDADLLHSKHRSRFLRLLNTFLSSSHLPASLIASFVKRLARLSLFAPPAAIVAIVPYIYNLLKAHPTCAFMIHRPPRPPYTPSTSDLRSDPFDMSSLDPQHTHALESSLWELETLQSHYHPNVASLARIISEQFTKQQYSLEDFLDHGYESMVDSELAKEAKKAPVVEWRIPKRILIKGPVGGSGKEGRGERMSLVQQLWDFG